MSSLCLRWKFSSCCAEMAWILVYGLVPARCNCYSRLGVAAAFCPCLLRLWMETCEKFLPYDFGRATPLLPLRLAPAPESEAVPVLACSNVLKREAP